jgi:uncharacterized protein (TIGR03083 family)
MTTFMAMDHDQHCDRLELEVDRMAELIGSTPPTIPVPGCPGWTVADLALHLGTVHRWAEHLVRVQAAVRIPASEMGLDQGPPDSDWLRVGGAALLATLRAADPNMPMWAWGADQHIRFWSRRQLHETLVHRFDVELALGISPVVPTDLAADAIDEFFDNLAAAAAFSPSVSRLRDRGERIVFRAEDSGRSWTAELHHEGFSVGEQPIGGGGQPSTTLSGPDATLLLVLYRRLGLAGAGLQLHGSRDLVDFWIDNSALE